MCPASLRQGMITLVLGWLVRVSRLLKGEGRATIPNIKDSQSKSGRCPR